MMATINMGALLEYGRAQGVSRCAGVVQVDRNPAAIAAVTKVKLTRNLSENPMATSTGREPKGLYRHVHYL
jgi:hypothetical protein